MVCASMHHQTRVSIELILKFLLCFASSPVTVRATTSILEQGLPVYVFTSDELVHWVMLLFARMLACSGTRKRDSKTTTHIRWTSLFIPYKFQIRLAGHGNLFPRCDGGARSSRVSTYTAAIIMSTSDLDYALALSLQEQFSRELKHESGRKRTTTTTEPEAAQLLERYDPRLIVDKRWELLDPHPNVHDLFVQFDAMFFERRLVNAGVEVRWSPRMTL